MKNPKSAKTLLIAPDSFKGGLSAKEVALALADGIRRADPTAVIRQKPLADGGEGTAAAILASRPDGIWVPLTVSGPLPERRVRAGFAWFADDRTALVEMAAANGLALLAKVQQNPLNTSTKGTGELIAAAVAHGARRILLAIGGSATVDGGIGAATALGWRFLDRTGNPVSPTGRGLPDIASIVPPADPDLPPVTVLCDVTNTLCGDEGAAAVFGPQKGATPAMVKDLEAGLKNLAHRMERLTGESLLELNGGGAAGGLGAGAHAFFGAELRSGIETIMEAARFHEALHGADWCITGEGSFDVQSLKGKVISGVAAAAQAAAVPVAVFAGRVRVKPSEYRLAGIRSARAIHAPDMPLEEALSREGAFLRSSAARWWREIRRRSG